MNRILFCVSVTLALLSACAIQPSSPDSSTNGKPGASSSSGVEFYGTVDVGVGTQRLSR